MTALPGYETADAPSPQVRAQLLLALLLLAIFPITLIYIPPPTHAVTISLGLIEEQLPPGLGGEGGWVSPVAASRKPARDLPLHFFSVSVILWPDETTPRHRLELASSGEIRLEGRRLDRAALARWLDRLAIEGTAKVDFQPHGDARYEDVVELLGLIARSDPGFFRLDNSPFNGALDLGARHPSASPGFAARGFAGHADYPQQTMSLDLRIDNKRFAAELDERSVGF